MRVIDIDAFRKGYRMNEHCEDCERNARECQYNDFSMMDFCGWLDDAPIVDAVPLDKLCEWLANSFSDTPCCTLENVRCKMECRGFTQMDYSECWRYVLTKWMEGLDDHNGTD